MLNNQANYNLKRIIKKEEILLFKFLKGIELSLLFIKIVILVMKKLIMEFKETVIHLTNRVFLKELLKRIGIAFGWGRNYFIFYHNE
jgi:hypothetical protein